MRRLLLHEARVHAIPGRTCATSATRSCSTIRSTRAVLEPARRAALAGRARRLRSAADRDARPVRVDSADSRTSGRRRSTMRPPTSPPGSSPTASATWARATSWSSSIRLPPGSRPAGRRADGVTIERLAGLSGRGRGRGRAPIVEVLLDAFEVDAERQTGIEAETARRSGTRGSPTTSSARTAGRRRSRGVPRSTALSYLSSIGTAGWARGRGLGSLVTRLASADGLPRQRRTSISASSPRTPGPSRSTSDPGSQRLGRWCPDLVLI